MKKPLNPFRTAKRQLKKHYIITIKKTKNNRWILPIPDPIANAFGLQIGDVAVFDIINQEKFTIRFIKNTMYSFVERF